MTLPTAGLIALLWAAAPPDPLPGFRRAAWFDEQVREAWGEAGVRAVVNAPVRLDPAKPTRLLVYATPNGNSIEQTLGRGPAPGQDWHFDIQHVAAQVRRLREVSPGENVVLACVEAEGLAWKRAHADAPIVVRRVVDGLKAGIPGSPLRVTLAGHSGGGSFLFAHLDAADAVPDEVEAFAFLDANYGYSDADKHGDKLVAWLKAGADRRLAVIAYDDRNVKVNGKNVVGPTGGTYRATGRMLDRIGKDVPLAESKDGPLVTHTGLAGRLLVRVHANPENRILHTALVGDMNGLLEASTAGRPGVAAWGRFGGPRAYAAWVQPAPGIPTRPADAPGGAAFVASLAALKPGAREEAIFREVGRGNVPAHLRTFHPISVKAGTHAATYEVMGDYLAVGSDTDFVRVPMMPATAQRIADAFGCALPTRMIVDDVNRAAAVRLEPRPMTEKREAVETFLRHDAIVREQLAGKPAGGVVVGAMKDVVVSNRLAEKPNKVAIYGWHRPDGTPIQPLTIVHRASYVDYSHGVRLMKRSVTVDGKPVDVRHALHAADLWPLLSDEGPLTRPSY